MSDILKSLQESSKDLDKLIKSDSKEGNGSKVEFKDGNQINRGCAFVSKNGDFKIIMDRMNASFDDDAITCLAKENCPDAKIDTIEEAKNELFNFISNGGNMEMFDPGFFQSKYVKINGRWHNRQDLGATPPQIL